MLNGVKDTLASAKARKRKMHMQRWVTLAMFLLTIACRLNAQDATLGGGGSMHLAIPVVVKFTGNITQFGAPIRGGYRGMTFALYKDQVGGEFLWMETHGVLVDVQGDFTVMLGSATSTGIPLELFASAEPRWIGLTLDDGEEQPGRVELSSVPYAFKAADADTLGGVYPADFVTQQQLVSALEDLKSLNSTIGANSQTDIMPPVPSQSSRLNLNLLNPLSDSEFAKLRDSNSFITVQTFVGGIVMPASNLEFDTQDIFDSAPLDFESSFPGQQPNSLTTQRFRWISQPTQQTNNGPSARWSLLFGVNGASPSPTGLSINSDGTINFASGQQLPTGAVMSAISDSSGGNGGTPGTNAPFVNSNSFQWSEQPSYASGIAVGTDTVTLAPCPRGMNGTDSWHYIYISGTGTPEVVLITGGSCRSGTASGTIEFSANYIHPPGYSISTATAGVQEAIIAADVAKTDGQLSRQVIIDPGSHLLRARVSVRSSAMTIISSGATLTCAMSDSCFMVGDPTNADEFNGITIQGLRLAPGIKSGTWSAIEDNAQGTRLIDIAPAVSQVSGASFGHIAQIDNDQAANLNGISVLTNYAWGRCDTTFCSSAIYGPGPFSKNAGVLWVQNANLSLQCGGNGIDNQDGNTLRVTNSIIQGYAQLGVRSATVFQQSNVQMNGVYQEEDGYCNPLGTGSTGLIVEGGTASVYGGAPAGLLPQFANTGSIQDLYYVVVHSSTLGTSPVYLAGYASSSGSGEVNIVWNKVGTAGTITYDLLRQTSNGGPTMAAPYGTGPFAVATGIPASSCANNVCSFVDNAGTVPATYSVADNTLYWPSLKLWPGNIILTSSSDMQNTGGGNPTTYFTDQLTKGSIVNSAGATYPSVFAQECNPQLTGSPLLEQCVGGNSVGNDYPPVVGTLLQMSVTGGAPGGLKGRLIFELPPKAEVGPTHVVTLSDSNPDKTLATPGNRPTNDPNDSYIGYDGGYFPSKMQIALGAPVAISRYIGNAGDGTSFLERLTATQEIYRVPLSLDPLPFAGLPVMPDGTELYCYDCQNIHDDGASFDTTAIGGGHGTNVLHENGEWRVH
jgi:hypothetical protein